MPGEASDSVMQRLHDALKSRAYGRDFDPLSPDDCRAIYEILVATKKDLPAYWRDLGATP